MAGEKELILCDKILKMDRTTNFGKRSHEKSEPLDST